MPHPLTSAQQMIVNGQAAERFIATVVSERHGGVVVQREGSQTSEGPYPRLSGVVVAKNDRVFVTRVGTGYIVAGKIDRATVPLAPAAQTVLVFGGEVSGPTDDAVVNTYHAGTAHILGGEVTGPIDDVVVETVHSGSAHVTNLSGEVTGSPGSATVATTHAGSAHALENAIEEAIDYSVDLVLGAGTWIVFEGSQSLLGTQIYQVTGPITISGLSRRVAVRLG